MSTLIQLAQASKAYGPKKLFQGASFSINEGEHVGVIGPNGAGKSTLFKVLTGQETLDNGEIILAKKARIGYLAQHDEWVSGETVEEYISKGTSMPLWDMKALGVSLGLANEVYHQPIESLSGGYRMRCKLLKLLGTEPDLLLLDEPTNYLDLESLLALENFLQGYAASFLLISHDREFLRRTTDHILEVEAGDITKYNGSLDDYFEQKALLRSQLEARALSIEEKRKEILDFVARFGAKATKASQAQSRLKSLDRLETIEIKNLPQTAVIRIPEPVRTGKLILHLSQVDLGYTDKTVLKNISFSLERSDHLAVVGVNGAGKSTFLKALAGKLSPLKGEIKWGHEVSVGYYAQHVSEALDPEQTVLEAMGARAHSSVSRQEVLNLAGALLFSGDDVSKIVSFLSGGEKSRVALGQILLQKSPCLILDEPTNHLDFQTVEALTVALSEYPGTVVVVSHDRGFIRRVGSKILEISNGQAALYPGSYDEYVWSCQKGGFAKKQNIAGTEQATLNVTKDQSSAASVASWEKKKEQERRLRKIEKELLEINLKIPVLQKKIAELNEKISSEPQHPELALWIEEIGKLQKQSYVLEESWLSLEEEKESINRRI